MPQKKILSISYDEPLLLTRQMILEREGFAVVSAVGYVEALRRMKDGPYDLVIMGHSIPRTDQTAMMNAIREAGWVSVLSIRRHGDLPLPGSDASVDAIDGPQVLVDAVHSILNSNGAAPAAKASESKSRRSRK